MLDVRRLKVLREVARQGSFSAAAGTLHFTQPAISRQIQALEQEAGTTLVERTARGIRLTQAGELLVEHADAVLARLEAAERQLEALASLDSGVLRVGAFPTADATLIPRAFAAFAKEFPGVELRLVEGESPTLVVRLHAGDLDLAVVSDVDVRDVVRLDLLMEDPLHVALPRDHPLAHVPVLSIDDLRDETWIEGRARSTMLPLVAACARAGFEPRIAFESTQWLGKQGLVAAGLGVTLIPQIALANVRDDVVLRSLGADAPVRRIYLATAERGYAPPALAPLIAQLRQVAADHIAECSARVD